MTDLKPNIQRLTLLMNEAQAFLHKLRDRDGLSGEVIKAADMWGKIKDKVVELTQIAESIDTQTKDLSSDEVSDNIKEIIRERLERDVEASSRKLKSALSAEKEVRNYLADAQTSLNKPKEDADSEKENGKKTETKREKIQKATKPKGENTATNEDQKIIKHIEDSVVKFQKGVPEIEKGVYEELLSRMRELQLQGGKIINNVQNLKLINNIRNKLERMIITEGYKETVKEFIRSFEIVESLNLAYFAKFNATYTPAKTLPIIREQAIDRTLNGLLGQGIGVNVVDRISDMLTQSTTTGGSYASLTEQLRTSVRGNSEQEGMLQKYTRTITTDAINQYSAQYHETIAQDLGFNWMRYIGSNITTTREFCERLTAKEWIHKSELPEIVKGKIDGIQCRLNKQGLPLGMIPGTDKDNFKVRRGGYNCGHQAFWVPDSAVPENIKQRIK